MVVEPFESFFAAAFLVDSNFVSVVNHGFLLIVDIARFKDARPPFFDSFIIAQYMRL